MMKPLLMGAIGMGALVISMFFARYWQTSRDRLYLFFAASFAVQGLDRFILALIGDGFEDQSLFYLLRLVAYLFIIIAIVDKNRSILPQS